ncbi:glycosyltransferase family 4 protein [Pseudaestuariivita sp.]|uniref:glycosyltransferase family 4 protein n=1 Tax=Pseudaestuariivita sp. TaxID=2211669 RepID=UPI004058C7CA
MTRVLLIAEAANPNWVSVPLIGWSLSRALAEVADVTLVTQVRNRDDILQTGLVEGSEFVAIDSEAVMRPAWGVSERLRGGAGVGWTMLQAVSRFAYPYFERLVWQRFGPEIEAGAYDIVHRITPLSPTQPSPIAGKVTRAGVPFVLGPLNGGVPWPDGFDAERRQEKEWLSYVRGAYKYLPGHTSTYSAASAIIAGSRHTASELPHGTESKTFYIPENGIDPSRFAVASRAAQAQDGPLRACFVGRLVPYKGPDMLIEAARPMLEAGRMQLDIIGDGPMRPSLEDAARELGPAVTFHGWKDHTEVQQILAQSHLLSFPSIREFGGGVVLEAMALGVVPLIVDYAGPGELVSADVGLKVPLGGRADIVTRFRTALEALVQDRTGLPALAAAAHARVQSHFLWSRKAEQIFEIYKWCLSRGSAPKPRFF